MVEVDIFSDIIVVFGCRISEDGIFLEMLKFRVYRVVELYILL